MMRKSKEKKFSSLQLLDKKDKLSNIISLFLVVNYISVRQIFLFPSLQCSSLQNPSCGKIIHSLPIALESDCETWFDQWNKNEVSVCVPSASFKSQLMLCHVSFLFFKNSNILSSKSSNLSIKAWQISLIRKLNLFFFQLLAFNGHPSMWLQGPRTPTPHPHPTPDTLNHLLGSSAEEFGLHDDSCFGSFPFSRTF